MPRHPQHQGHPWARTDSNATHIRVQRSRRIHRAILIPTCHAIASRGVPAVLRICAVVVLPPVVCHSGMALPTAPRARPSSTRTPRFKRSPYTTSFVRSPAVEAAETFRGRGDSTLSVNSLRPRSENTLRACFAAMASSSKTPDPFDALRAWGLNTVGQTAPPPSMHWRQSPSESMSCVPFGSPFVGTPLRVELFIKRPDPFDAFQRGLTHLMLSQGRTTQALHLNSLPPRQ